MKLFITLTFLLQACALARSRSATLIKTKKPTTITASNPPTHDEDHHHQQHSTSSSNNILVKARGGAAAAIAEKVPLSLVQLALAGSIATMIGDASMHPIDCIKTLQQSDEGIGLSFFGAGKQIFSKSGVGGFYSGMGTYVTSDGMAGALKFATYEALKQWTERHVPEEKRGSALFACAGIAFLASSVVLVPGELIKQRLQMGQITSVAQGIKSIWANEGILGFFTGYSGVCLRDVPYTMLELGLYDNFKRIYFNWKSRDDPDYKLSQFDELIAAAVTGGITGYFTTPLDTIKTKLMVDSKMYSGFFDCAAKSIQANGWGSLFQGSAARVAWLMPFTAIYLPIYDFFKRKLEEYNNPTLSNPLNVKGGAQQQQVRHNNFRHELSFRVQRGVQLVDSIVRQK